MDKKRVYTPNCEILSGMDVPDGLRRVCLGLEYDGQKFRGFQIQPHDTQTVQQALHDSLSSIANHEVSLVCAGRTDSGVHASGQVVHFDITVERPVRAWTLGANTKLPDQIAVRWALEVPRNFHARFSAKNRTYRYILQNSPSRPGIFNKKVTWDKRCFDLSLMQKAASILTGTHDFSSFRASQCQARSPIRTIQYIHLARLGEFIVMEIQANAFLHHMVRNIMGVLTAVGAGERPLSWVSEVLAAKDRQAAGVTAPPFGLYLVNVDYPDEFTLPKTNPGPGFVQVPLGGFGSISDGF